MLPAILIISVAIVAWALAFALNRRAVRRHDGAGDPAQGVLIFVEPVRWLFIIWGFGPFCRGLRRAGWKGQTRLFRWSTAGGALLVIPDVVRRGHLRTSADRLAQQIQGLPRDAAAVSNQLVAYSSGCYVAAEALKQCDVGQISNTVLLSSTLSPCYPMRRASRRCGQLYHFHSPLDLLNLLGPMLIGTNDRRWSPSSGSVGLLASARLVRQRSWLPEDMRLAWFGDHFTIVSPSFIARHVAPIFLS